MSGTSSACLVCHLAPCSCGPSSAVQAKLADPNAPISTSPGGSIGTLDACAGLTSTNPGNLPISDAEYQCSLGVQLAPHIDAARQQVHLLGLRPYRVFLVWEERNTRQVYTDLRRVELMPVKVIDLSDVALELGIVGLHQEGLLRLTEISTVQVTEQDLRGDLDGASIDRESPSDIRFFYEVAKIPRCADDPKPQRRRFVLANNPHHDGTAFGWDVVVVSQEFDRSPEGLDQTFVPMDGVINLQNKFARIRR